MPTNKHIVLIESITAFCAVCRGCGSRRSRRVISLHSVSAFDYFQSIPHSTNGSTVAAADIDLCHCWQDSLQAPPGSLSRGFSDLRAARHPSHRQTSSVCASDGAIRRAQHRKSPQTDPARSDWPAASRDPGHVTWVTAGRRRLRPADYRALRHRGSATAARQTAPDTHHYWRHRLHCWRHRSLSPGYLSNNTGPSCAGKRRGGG